MLTFDSIIFFSLSFSGSNAFDLPFLSLIGTLDGGGITYAAREFEETAALSDEVRKTTFSLILEDVNHSQVGLESIGNDKDVPTKLWLLA